MKDFCNVITCFAGAFNIRNSPRLGQIFCFLNGIKWSFENIVREDD